MAATANSCPENDGDGLAPDRPVVREIIRLFDKEPMGLADYHAVGERMSELEGHKFPRWRERLARHVKKSEATLNKCLQFYKEYRRGELPELVRLGVGWGRLTIAFAVKDKDERHRLLRRAKDEGWTDRELQQEVKRANGSYRGGGRRRKQRAGRGCLAAVAELITLTGRWIDFHEHVWSAGRRTYAAEAGTLTPESREQLRRRLEDARVKVLDLRRRCEEVLAALRAILGGELPEGQGAA